MKKPTNTILFAANYFKDELNGFFDASELDQILQITFSHYFNLSRVDLTIKAKELLSDTDFNKLEKVVHELKINKPLAQIIGEWEFYGLTLRVNEHTLIPRPETEELVQLIIEENKEKEGLSILDIGTGSGCIALALKEFLPSAKVYAYDVSGEALKVAIFNADKNNLEVTFEKVDILQPQKPTNKFDIIVSNPPYICHQEKNLMNSNVLDYEPHLALFVDDNNPLLFYNEIAQFALNNLKDRGRLYFEINERYGEKAKQLLIDKKFKNINIVKDLNEKDRIVNCQIN